MSWTKILVTSMFVAQLAACGGSGNVSASFADRGSAVERADSVQQVRTAARAVAFDSENGISTRGKAEIIYRAGGWGQKTDRASFVLDALERAREVSRCATAVHSHSQDSVQGIHVMILLSDCPPLSRT